MIRDGFNTFQIIENGITKPIILQIGNYSLSEFTLELTRALNVGTTFTYTITFNNRLGKFKYDVTLNSNYQPTFIFTTNVYEQLGFYSDSSNIFVNNSLTSSCIINLNPNEMVFICSDLVNNAVGSILEVIPMCGSPDFSFVYYQATSTHQIKELTNRNNQTFNFRITDSRFNILDLNGKEVSISICLHEEDNTNMLIRENILIKNAEKLNNRRLETTKPEAPIGAVAQETTVQPTGGESGTLRERENTTTMKSLDGKADTNSNLEQNKESKPDPNMVDSASIQTIPNLDQSNFVIGFN